MRDVPVDAAVPCGLTWSGEFLWFSDSRAGRISALDPVLGRVEHTIPCPEIATDLTTVAGNLVQVVGAQRGLAVLDPDTGATLHRWPNPRPGHALCGLEATRMGIWFGYADLCTAELRDAIDHTLLRTVPLREPMAGLTVSDHYLAYSNPQLSTINVVDIERGRDVASYDVPGAPTGVAWDGTRIWYCDAATLQVRAIEVLGISRR